MTDATVIPTRDLVETYRPQLEGNPVLLFDGVCVFCNRTVQLLLRIDRDAVFRFVPLESPLGEQLLARFEANRGAEGVVLITDVLTGSECISHRSDAIIGTLKLLPALWPALSGALRLIPRRLREFGYGLIARYRYRLFGRHQTCPIPTAEQRGRILGIAS